MKKLSLGLSLVVATGLIALGFGLLTSGKLNAASANANVNAEIQSPLTISKTKDLDFGVIEKVASGTCQAVIIGGDANGSSQGTSDGSWDSSSTCTLVGGSPQKAAFTVSGAAGAGVDVSVSNITSPQNTAGDTLDLTITGGTHYPSSITLDSTNGEDTLYVGGKLTVGNDDDAGTYNAGSFTVEVTYQ